MKWWVWSTTEEHFIHSTIENIWASNTSNVKKHVKKGDYILFYVSKEEGHLQGSFRGTAKITGNWNLNHLPKWPMEKRRGRVMWPWQCNIEHELIFNVKFNDVKTHLGFIKNKKNPGLAVKNSNTMGPANMGKPVDYVDIHALKAFAAEPRLMKKLFDMYKT